jgi:PKD repeat protein
MHANANFAFDVARSRATTFRDRVARSTLIVLFTAAAALAGCRDEPTAPASSLHPDRPLAQYTTPGLYFSSIGRPQYSGGSYSFFGRVLCGAPTGPCSCSVTAYAMTPGAATTSGSCDVGPSSGSSRGFGGNGRLVRAGIYEVIVSVSHAYGHEGGSFSVYLDRLPVPMTASADDATHLTVALTVDDPTRVALGTVRLGDGNVAGISIAAGEDGAPLTSVQDVNDDGKPELLLRFRWDALEASGALADPARGLVLLGDYTDRSQFEAKAPLPPRIAMTITLASSFTGIEGSPVTFAATVQGGQAPITWQWSFGDAGAASTVPAAHAYANDGTFAVAVSATDAGGRTATATSTAMIANAPPVLTLDPGASIASGERFTVRGQVTDAGANDAPWRWNVQWPSGISPTTGAIGHVPGEIVASEALYRAGRWTVPVRVEDADGGIASASIEVLVTRLPVTMKVAPATLPAAERGNGLLTVTLFTTGTVRASDVDVATVRLAGVPVEARGNGAAHATLEDVNGDGVPELVLKFRRAALRDGGSSGSVLVLHADLVDRRQIQGVSSLAAKAGIGS